MFIGFDPLFLLIPFSMNVAVMPHLLKLLLACLVRFIQEGQSPDNICRKDEPTDKLGAEHRDIFIYLYKSSKKSNKYLSSYFMSFLRKISKYSSLNVFFL